ncbi:AAA family ATPase [Bifidobacterium sp. LC6]|uniref:Nuclease SbcCD subunit C n=1 Tax=Bifidobacterium colobi TaxID=2809026 RepID=A0ABS5UWK5_9BIFI|nr:AAA family ATPase [Bifidobacterium colobi]MBT1175484.1 AAA family ATPase [Bifidobacterium colobi]
MKLIAMKFRGVGPYKGEFAIDFAALTSSHMFLIDGETGAGKTTILDCLTFALYGGTSGATSSGEETESKQRFRSRFLMNERTETYVDLIFKAGNDYYEIRRTPSYDHPTLNGNKPTTRHSSKATLLHINRGLQAVIEERINDPERYFDYAQEKNHAEAVASKEKEVGVQITRLIGLNRKQFSRTIMLAQGQFAEFLKMKPEDRTGLVKDLLGAEIYQQIQDDLNEQRKALQGTVNDNASSLKSQIANARVIADQIVSPDIAAQPGAQHDPQQLDALSEEAQQAQPVDTQHPNTQQWGLNDAEQLDYPVRSASEIHDALTDTITNVSATLKQLVKDGESEQEQAQKDAESAQRRRQTVEQLRGYALQEKEDLDAVHNLHARHNAYKEWKHRIASSDEAQPIIDKHHELMRAEKAHEQQDEQLKDTQDMLDAYPPRATLEQERDAATAAGAREKDALVALEQATAHQHLVENAKEAQQQYEQAATHHAHAQSALQECVETLQSFRSADDIQAEITQANQRLGGRKGLTDQLEHSRKMLQYAEEAQQLADETIPATRKKLDEAEQHEEDAQRTLETMRAAILRSGAAQYAEGLAEGQPCPVCGSTHHPQLASQPDSSVSQQELKALEKRYEDARESTEKLRNTLTGLSNTLSAKREQSEQLSIEQAQRNIEEIQQQLNDLDSTEQHLVRLQDELHSVNKATQAVNDAKTVQATAEESEHNAQKRLNTAVQDAKGYTDESVRKEREQAENARDTAQEQQQRAKNLQRKLDELDALEKRHAEQRATWNEQQRQIKEIQQAIDGLLTASQFSTVLDACNAALDEQQREALQTSVEQYDTEVTEAQAHLQRTREEFRHAIADLDDAMKQALDLASVTKSAKDDSTTAVSADAVAYCDDGTLTSLGNAVSQLDLDTFQEQEQQATDRLTKANTASGSLQTVSSTWHAAATKLKTSVTTWQQSVTKFEPLQRMASLANADQNSPSADKRKMSLITFAVTERFRDVLDRANDLLNDIQGGVYELQLDQDSEQSTAGSKKLGLAITVFDRRTEEKRSTATLSGGETFFVSLALALALADIIQAENGGIAMDTLFVDEGFGSLSEEYLDDVMDMLRRIAKTRDIGIISHVGILKDQIAEKISVSRVTPNGESRLEVLA